MMEIESEHLLITRTKTSGDNLEEDFQIAALHRRSLTRIFLKHLVTWAQHSIDRLPIRVTLSNLGALAIILAIVSPRTLTYMLLYPIFRLVFGTLYPAYASYKAVRTQNVKEYVKWMMYWIVFALFTCAETFTDVFFSFWFPFYYEIKIILVLWLLSPATKGSSILYRRFVHPALTRRENEIDEALARATEQGYKAVLQLGTRGVNYATTVLMQTAIKGGGGLVQQLRKSYSLSDLTGGKDVENRSLPESRDETDMEGEPRRREHVGRRGYSPRRTQSSTNRVEMYFSEVDVDVIQPRPREPIASLTTSTNERETERATNSTETTVEDVVIEHQEIETVDKEEAAVAKQMARLIFNAQRETNMLNELLECSSIFYGLLPQEIRKLAYECAVKFGIRIIPPSWHQNSMADTDWLSYFLTKNPGVVIRTPETTSSSCTTAFNRDDVKHFFSKLREILCKYNLPPSRVWNLDERKLRIVLKPNEATALAEHRKLVTIEMAISASGSYIPPMFIFPECEEYRTLLVRNCPPESIVIVNSSGLITTSEFLIYMDHFIKYAKSTPSEPVLLLLDNDSSHISINVIEKAEANGIIMLSFPPSCDDWLQPLNAGVYKLLKSYSVIALKRLQRYNPERNISIYDYPIMIKYALPLAATPNTIINTFIKTGIYPLNENIFTNKDFMPLVTDRPSTEHPGTSNSMNRIVEENESKPENNVGAFTKEFSSERNQRLPRASSKKNATKRRNKRSAASTRS